MPEFKFRWAVGTPNGEQSPPWTLTVRGGEFTLAARAPRQGWHVSFHASGERHFRFDSPELLELAGGPSSGRDADVWRAPDAVDRVAREFVMVVPTSELRLPASKRKVERITWLDPAPSGEALRIVICRRVPGAPAIDGVWSAPLTTGDELVVITSTGPLEPEVAALLEERRAVIAGRAHDRLSMRDPSGFVWGNAGDGVRFWMVVEPD